MKFTYWFIAVIITSYLMSYIGHRNDKKKRMDLVESSYGVGCFQEAMHECAKNKNVFIRGACYQEAYENCPVWGHKFRKALEDYKP